MQVTFTAIAGPVQIGQEITYTGSVKNNGPNDASQVTLDIPVPPGAILSGGGSPPAGLICDNDENGFTGTLHCSAVTYANGFTSNFQIRFTPVSPVASLAATATVASATSDPNTNNNAVTATTTVSSSSVAPTTTGLNPSNAPQNGPGNFTLTVQGTGFTLASKILFNGVQRATTNFQDNKDIGTPITATDLQTAANITVTVNTPGPGGGTSNAQTFTVVGNVQNQTINFPAIAAHTFGDAAFNLSATASSGLPVAFSIVPGGTGSGTINGSTLTITAAGTIIIQADQGGSANFNPAPSVQQTLTVNKANQTITFAAIPNKGAGDPAFNLSASSTSGLLISFTATVGPGLVSINGNTVTITGTGNVTIQASQVGNTNFNAAASVPQSFTISKASALLTLNTPTQIADGNPKVATVTTTPPGLGPITITYNGSTTAPSLPGSYTVVATLNNPNFTSNTPTATLRIVSFTPTNQTVIPGSSQTAFAPPAGSNPGISANLTHTPGGVAAGLTVGVFSGNPADKNVLNVGGGFADVMVTNSNVGDTAVVNFYYPSSVTGTNETQLQFFYFTGFTWAPVKDGSGNLATKNTTDNLDSTTSGGRFTITLSNTSQPRVNQLTGTFFTASTAIVGDCDLNGVVNVTDLIVMANALAGNLTLTPTQKATCDVLNDGSGLITIQDLITLANFLAGNIKTLPVNTAGGNENPGDIIPQAFTILPTIPEEFIPGAETYIRYPNRTSLLSRAFIRRQTTGFF
jgi:hypothetical protein